MKKRMMAIAIIAMFPLCACGKGQEKPSIPVTESYVTYYQKEDGTSIKVVDGKEEKVAASNFAVLDEGKFKHEDGSEVYQKLIYAEVEDGFDIDFGSMKICGQGYKDGSEMDGYSMELSKNEDVNRQLITLTFDTDFDINDVELYIRNDSNGEYEEGKREKMKMIDIDKVNFDRTFQSSMHLFKLNGHFYVWDQTIKPTYPECGEGEKVVKVSSDCLYWIGDGGSAEELFTALAEKSEFASEVGGKPFKSKAKLTMEKEGDKYFLVKTSRTDMEDEKANPPYIAYTEEEGGGTIYIAIL